MKLFSICTLAVLSLALQASASITSTFTYNSEFSNGTIIPDGSASGWSDTRTVGGLDGYTVTDVSVTLNISGTWNGDLYGYLVHDSGFVVLLDRVGQTDVGANGYSTAGFGGIKISDSANYADIQTTANPLSNTSYNSKGSSSEGSTLATAFDNTTANGNWTLFLADLSAGDISQVQSWSLEITSVPEPSTWAMIAFGVIFGGWQFAKRRMAR